MVPVATIPKGKKSLFFHELPKTKKRKQDYVTILDIGAIDWEKRRADVAKEIAALQKEYPHLSHGDCMEYLALVGGSKSSAVVQNSSGTGRLTKFCFAKRMGPYKDLPMSNRSEQKQEVKHSRDNTAFICGMIDNVTRRFGVAARAFNPEDYRPSSAEERDEMLGIVEHNKSLEEYIEDSLFQLGKEIHMLSASDVVPPQQAKKEQGKFLHGSDCKANGKLMREVTLKVTSIRRAPPGFNAPLIMEFEKQFDCSAFPLNKTNVRALGVLCEQQFGSDDLEKLTGHSIVFQIVSDNNPTTGASVPALRVASDGLVINKKATGKKKDVR